MIISENSCIRQANTLLYYLNNHQNLHIGRSAMEDNDLKKEYDELLPIYSRKKSERQSACKEIDNLKTYIDQLKKNINDCIIPEPQTLEPHQKQKQELVQQQEELNNILAQLLSQLTQNSQQEHLELKQELNSLQALNANLVYQEKNEEKRIATAQLSAIQPQISEQEKKLEGLQSQVLSHQQRLKVLQQELATLNNVKTQSNQIGEASESISDLENRLKSLEQEQAILGDDIKKENDNFAEKSKKSQLQEQRYKKQLQQAKANNSSLKNTLTKLQQELKKLQSESVKPNDQSELVTLQANQRNLLREVEDYTKEVTIKKVEVNKKKEDAKKQKNKDKRNFKQEILEEQTLNQLLTKELDREQKRLENTIKIRKSYVPQENLQILQKQFQRHQLKGKPNLQAQEKQRQKLVRQNQMIKSRISFLTSAAKQMEKQSQRKLRELKEKGDDLVKQKLANQKVLGQATYKLNEYLRVYPDHEKRKQEVKILQKKRRQELKEEQKLQQQRKAALRRQEQKEVLIEKALQEDNNETAWDKWDKWDKAGNLSTQDQTSIFNNRQFQIGAAIVAFIGILLLSFS